MAEFEIYLASASPRRRELLEQVGVHYRLLSVSVSERVMPEETPESYVQRVALDKARAGRDMIGQQDTRPVLGSDTAVVVDDVILGKPKDKQEALAMLRQLSGREHRVLTAVALANEQEQTRLNISSVAFRQLTEEECEQYWQTGECIDKAGAYAIQGYAAAFIRELRGSYSGVMGLPLFETAELLQQAGIGLFLTKN